MPEIKVQDPVCGKCGTEVRPDTAFCYNCGAAVTTEPETGGSEVDDNRAVENTAPPVINGNSARLEDRRPDPPKYESAASLRKRSRPAMRIPVEVTWEPKTESPNMPFIIATICLVALAIILIVAAQYLK